MGRQIILSKYLLPSRSLSNDEVLQCKISNKKGELIFQYAPFILSTNSHSDIDNPMRRVCLFPVHTINFKHVTNINKKVLLRERKRHTDRHVQVLAMLLCLLIGGGKGYPIQSWMGAVPYLVLDRAGYPIQSWIGGTPSSLGWGVPHPVLDGGYPIQSWMGGTPSQVWTGGTPSNSGWGVP